MAQSADQQLSRAERDARVIEAKTRGFTFRQIGNMGIDGVGDGSQAYRCFKRGMKSIPAVPAQKYRQLENEKMDSVERRLQAIMTKDGADTKDQLRAAQTLLQVMRHRAQLNGLNLQPSGDLTTGVQTVLVDMSVVSKSLSEPDFEVGEESPQA